MVRLDKERLLEMFDHPGWSLFMAYLEEQIQTTKGQYYRVKDLQELGRCQGQEQMARFLLESKDRFNELAEDEFKDETHFEV